MTKGIFMETRGSETREADFNKPKSKSEYRSNSGLDEPHEFSNSNAAGKTIPHPESSKENQNTNNSTEEKK